MGSVLIGLGLIFAICSWALASQRKDLRHHILALADHGPCTGLELKRRSGSKYINYQALDEAIEMNLVTVRYRVNSQRTAAIRGELKTREFRLTTSGWQAATRLRAGGQLKDLDA